MNIDTHPGVFFAFMADQPIKYNSQIEKDEHDDSANIPGKRVILVAWNPNTLQYERVTSASGVLQTSGSGGSGGTSSSVTLQDGSTPSQLLAIDSNGQIGINNLPSVQPISASSLPLPTGAAQESGGNLDSIKADLDTVVTNTNKIISAPATSANQASIITSVSSIDSKIPALGQALAAASVPVILPSATISTLTPPAAITNYANETGGNLAAAKADLDTIVANTNNIPSSPAQEGGNLATIATNTTDIATIGSKTDAKSTATDGTSVSLMSVLKEISAMCQTPPTTPVSGTFWQSTQPVSIATMPTTPVTGTFWQSTQPVSLASVPSHAVTNAGTFAVQTTATTSGGYTPGKLVSAASTNATSIKSSAGTLGYLTASNINASPRYLKIYNKASAPTVGTDTPVHTFLIPGNTAGAGTNIPLPPQGIALGTGIAIAITTGAADSDTGAVAASEIIVNYGTK